MDKSADPLISVVTPTLNEEPFIASCLQSILKQDLDAAVEIIVVDGESTDKTVEVVKEIQQENPQITLVANPQRYTSFALNIALEHARGTYLARVDAHSYLPPDYLRKCLTTFQEVKQREPRLVGVGGRWQCANRTPLGKTIFRATTTWFGGGISKYRYTGKGQFTRTVLYGFYIKEILVQEGFADEDFIRAQDAELNQRLLNSGYRLYYNPEIYSYYHAPNTIRKLGRHLIKYGRARSQLIRKHPKSFRFVFLLPIGLVLYLVGLPFLLLTSQNIFWLLPWGTYLAINLFFSLKFFLTGNQLHTDLLAPLIFAVSQICYGLGMILEPLKKPARKSS